MPSIALLVGIDDYPQSPLSGCVNDVLRLKTVLERNHDETPNFSCRDVTSLQGQQVTRAVLREHLETAFSKSVDIALFFFAGHGTENNLEGYLVTQDATAYDEGVAMSEVIRIANASPAQERIILLDCCHAGHFGNIPGVNNTASLAEGTSILAACRDTESAMEFGNGGLFTTLLCEALSGGAADVTGKVTIASIYAYVDEVFSAWEQRPLFKTHVSKLASVRNCKPSVPLATLRKLPTFFPHSDYKFPLEPAYEPDLEPEDPDKQEVFECLQRLNRARLVEPIDALHMYYAAMYSKECKLTELGKFYWHRAQKNKI